MAQMWRTGLALERGEPRNRESKTTSTILKSLSKEFIRELDSSLPEDQKLPRDEDDSFNLRAKDEGSIRARH